MSGKNASAEAPSLLSLARPSSIVCRMGKTTAAAADNRVLDYADDLSDRMGRVRRQAEKLG